MVLNGLLSDLMIADRGSFGIKEIISYEVTGIEMLDYSSVTENNNLSNS